MFIWFSVFGTLATLLTTFMLMVVWFEQPGGELHEMSFTVFLLKCALESGSGVLVFLLSSYIFRSYFIFIYKLIKHN